MLNIKNLRMIKKIISLKQIITSDYEKADDILQGFKPLKSFTQE